MATIEQILEDANIYDPNATPWLSPEDRERFEQGIINTLSPLNWNALTTTARQTIYDNIRHEHLVDGAIVQDRPTGTAPIQEVMGLDYNAYTNAVTDQIWAQATNLIGQLGIHPETWVPMPEDLDLGNDVLNEIMRGYLPVLVGNITQNLAGRAYARLEGGLRQITAGAQAFFAKEVEALQLAHPEIANLIPDNWRPDVPEEWVPTDADLQMLDELIAEDVAAGLIEPFVIPQNADLMVEWPGVYYPETLLDDVSIAVAPDEGEYGVGDIEEKAGMVEEPAGPETEERFFDLDDAPQPVQEPPGPETEERFF